MFQMGQFIFMIDVKKNNTVIWDFDAVVALLRHTAALFSTYLTPLVDESIVPATNVFFKSTMVNTTHLTIRIARIDQ